MRETGLFSFLRWRRAVKTLILTVDHNMWYVKIYPLIKLLARLQAGGFFSSHREAKQAPGGPVLPYIPFIPVNLIGFLLRAE
jgi:hypothetical protein